MKKIRLFMGAFVLLASATGASAQQPSPTVGTRLVEKYEVKPGEIGISYEKYILPNGLTVIVHEDHSDPVVHVDVTYKVGSNREVRGKTGFAHFFEHMMFQGSKHVGDEQHFNIVQGAGGTMNGSTTDDRTNYYQTMPSNQLEVALWLEADRMGFLLDSVTQQKFEVQRSTVKNEKSQNVENQPYALAFVEILPQNLYPVGHPYSWPTIGYVEDLDRVNVNDLKTFFMRWYGPNNAILTVAGDVNAADVLKYAEKYFGPIKPGKPVKKLKVDPVVLPTKRFVAQPDNIYFPAQVITYPTVPNYHKDEPALDLLSSIIGGGVNSPIYQALVKSEKAVQAGVSHPCSELAGQFQILVLQFPKYSQQEIINIVEDVIAKFDPNAINDDQLQRAKMEMETRYTGILETVEAKASALSDWERLVGNRSYNIKDEIERYNKVTKADLVRVFDKYIRNANPLTVYIFPKDPSNKDTIKSLNPYPGITLDQLTDREKELEKEYVGLTYDEPKDNFDRSKKPAVTAAKAVTIPSYYEAKLTNGLEIIGTRTTEAPMVNIFITIKGGHVMEAYDPKKIGLSALTAQMMNEGTQKYTKEELEAELQRIGANVGVGGGVTETNISLRAPVKNLDKALQILEEMLYRPRFDAKDFKRVKNEAIENYYTEIKSAQLTVSKAYAKLLYGEDHILGAYYSGTAKTIDNISLEDVKSFYEKYYTPQLANVIIVGDIEKDQILPKLQFLNNWQVKNASIPQLSFTNQVTKTEIYLIDKINAATSEIRVGYPAMKYDYNGEFFKSTLMNYPMGGHFNSRVNLKLREEMGWTYGARTGFSGSQYPGSFTFSASIKTRATDSALRELFNIMNNYRNTGITNDELSYAKIALREADALKYESSFDKALFLSQITEYKLPRTYTQEQNEIIKNITKEELDALAKKNLPTDKMIIVIVGDKEYIIKGLESLGYGKPKTIDPDKTTVKPIK